MTAADSTAHKKTASPTLGRDQAELTWVVD